MNHFAWLIAIAIWSIGINGVAIAKPIELKNLKDKEIEQVCECKMASESKSFVESNHVIFGEVKSVTQHSSDLATAELHVMDTFKGRADYIKKVVGASQPGESCRKILEPGFYLVFSKNSQNVVLNACSSSRQLKPGSDLVNTLTRVEKLAHKMNIRAKLQNLKSSTSTEEKLNAKIHDTKNLDPKADFEEKKLTWFQCFINWVWELFFGASTEKQK